MSHNKDDEMGFSFINRAEADLIHRGDQISVYSHKGKKYIESDHHYTQHALSRIVEGKHSYQELEDLVKNDDMVKFRVFPTDTNLSEEEKVNFKTETRTGYPYDFVVKHWAELFFYGMADVTDGDGDNTLNLAKHLRSANKLTIDEESAKLDFFQYAVLLHDCEHRDPDYKTDMYVVQGPCEFGGSLDGVDAGIHWMTGPYLYVKLDTQTCFRKSVMEETFSIQIDIRSFEDGPMSSQDLRRITDSEHDQLAIRGQRILDSIGDDGISFVHYKGEALIPGFFGPSPEYADDRVIVDPTSLYTVQASLYNRMVESLGYDSDKRMTATKSFDKNIDKDNVWQIFPYSFGYLFSSKKWAMMDLSHSSEIKFRSDAIDKLVMDQSKKSMLLALVENYVTDQNDIVDGKGGGIITLLHGAPGLGKTLAAECVAEYTQKPLYKVSVGELGTSPDELEERLSRILNVATRWDAVLLIDEADIFLEARTTNDIARNAMVAIFLRLLEYYEGVLFLTTNRVKNFDPAFYSRIMLSFGFHEFGANDRRTVWTNLLGNCDIELSATDIEHLVHTDINARQIKNSINGARAIAKSQNTPVTVDHIQLMLDNTAEFMKDTKKD